MKLANQITPVAIPHPLGRNLRCAGTSLAARIVGLATAALRNTDPFDESDVEAAVRGTAAERGIKAGMLIHATRVAVTGRMASPGLFEVLVLLGRDRTVQQLERLVNVLATRQQSDLS